MADKKRVIADRRKRLREGRCPIHGLWMSQIDVWYYPKDGRPYTIVGCPREDCQILARAYSIDGPWELVGEFEALLDADLPDPEYLISAEKTSQRRKSIKGRERKRVWEKTQGKCYYCGVEISLEEMTVDHLQPMSQNGTNDLDNLVPTCRSCNASKGVKTVEEFRFLIRMKKFRASTGVSFTQEQIEYLRTLGVELPIPIHIFWFERHEKIKKQQT